MALEDPLIHSSPGSLLCAEWTGSEREGEKKFSAFVVQVNETEMNKCTRQSQEYSIHVDQLLTVILQLL